MAEAGELCHWEIVEKIADRRRDEQADRSPHGPSGSQREHVAPCREAYAHARDTRREEMAAA